MLLKRITDRDLGAGPSASGGFGGPAPSRWAIFWKKSYFNAIGSHFARVQSRLKALDFRHLTANRKNRIV